MSITKEEANRIIRYMEIKNIDYIEIYYPVLEGNIDIFSDKDYLTDKHILLITSHGNFGEGIEIESARIKNNKLHIVLETEEELLIPIRDD
jgi:hypothetical protein